MKEFESFFEGKKLKFKIALGIGIFSLIFTILSVIVILQTLGIIDIGNSNFVSPGVSYSPNSYIQSVENECSAGIMVGDQVYDLEEYVAGVVTAEADPGQNIEALKAQAIAARTYAVVRTDYCKNAIRNSSADQNFNVNATDNAKEAAKATNGLVLVNDSVMFLSEYDSFFNMSDYRCDVNQCSVTYTKLPNKESHVVSVSQAYKYLIAGGHGRGMSQVASYELADSGMNYKEILEYFYSPGTEIVRLAGTVGYTSGLSAPAPDTGISSRIAAPVVGNEHDDSFYYSENNLSYSTGFLGECTWYSYGRANEILSEVGSDLRWTHARDARYWLEDNIADGDNAFSYSTNVNEPKVGAIIVWDGGSHGHVAVVEAVNDDGTIDYSEGNIDAERKKDPVGNPHGYRYQSHISYAETGYGTISNIWTGYKFLGYIYMIE